jgi:hypothetical protein
MLIGARQPGGAVGLRLLPSIIGLDGTPWAFNIEQLVGQK